MVFDTQRYHVRYINIKAFQEAPAPDSLQHRKYFAERRRNAAKEMRAMAAAHDAMSKDVPKPRRLPLESE